MIQCIGQETVEQLTQLTAFPEVERYSGQIMYVENRGAVTREDQIEDIKLIIEM